VYGHTPPPRPEWGKQHAPIDSRPADHELVRRRGALVVELADEAGWQGARSGGCHGAGGEQLARLRDRGLGAQAALTEHAPSSPRLIRSVWVIRHGL